MGRRLLRVSGLAGMLALVACQHVTTSSRPAEGNTSFAFVDAPAIGGKQTELSLATEKEAVDVLAEARWIAPLAKPAFPAAALRGHAGEALVGVRLHVDVDGNVNDVGPSLVCFSTPGPFAAEFRTAVEAAVTQWKFTPAKRRHLEPVKLEDGSIYWRNASETRIDAVFDVAFTFSAGGEVTVPPIR